MAHDARFSTRSLKKKLWKQRRIDPLKRTTCFFSIMHFAKEPFIALGIKAIADILIILVSVMLIAC